MKKQIAVQLHAYNLDELNDILDLMSTSLKNKVFDLWVSIGIDHSGQRQIKEKKVNKAINKRFDFSSKTGRTLFVHTHENRGADLGGFVHSLKQMKKQGKDYDFLCKLHTKASDDVGAPLHHLGIRDRKDWKAKMLDATIGSEEQINKILTLFGEFNNVGAIGNIDTLFGGKVCTENVVGHEKYNKLCDSLGIQDSCRLPNNGKFFAGTMFWARYEIFKNLPDVIKLEDFEEGMEKPDGLLAHACERMLGALVENHRKLNVGVLGPKQRKQDKMPEDLPKLVSFYFPQFHEIEENNRFWGKGFTEWDNLREYDKVKHPNKDFLHPHEDIGYYDLSEKPARKKQRELAEIAGIDAFCMHHYWFDDNPVMDLVPKKILDLEEPNIDFFFNWANESWTKRWDGLSNEVIMEQKYGRQESWEKHIDYLIPFFKSPHYYKIDNKPVFAIYKIGDVRHLSQMMLLWEEKLEEAGFDGIHLVQCYTGFGSSNVYTAYSDAACEFFPNYAGFSFNTPSTHGHKDSICEAQGCKKDDYLMKLDDVWEKISANHVWHSRHAHEKKAYTGFFVGWDNSPRRKNGEAVIMMLGEKYFCKYLTDSIRNSMKRNPQNELYFINSWNEWGEGCVLEPSAELGYKNIIETKLAKRIANLFFVARK